MKSQINKEKNAKEEANNENKPNNEYQEIEIRDILKKEKILI